MKVLLQAEDYHKFLLSKKHVEFTVLRASQIAEHAYVHMCKADSFDCALTLHRTTNRYDLSDSVLPEISGWAQCPLIDYPFCDQNEDLDKTHVFTLGIHLS